MKVKHSKYKNTGLIFELLVKQIASDTLSKKDSPAFLLKKKDYKKEFVPLWGSCEKVIAANPEPKWTDLTKHIVSYSECTEAK